MSLGMPVPECLHSVVFFLLELRTRGGGDKWSYKTCKAPVKSSPLSNQHPAFYGTDVLPVAQPTVSQHWREKMTAWQQQIMQTQNNYFTDLRAWSMMASLRCSSIVSRSNGDLENRWPRPDSDSLPHTATENITRRTHTFSNPNPPSFLSHGNTVDTMVIP